MKRQLLAVGALVGALVTSAIVAIPAQATQAQLVTINVGSNLRPVDYKASGFLHSVSTTNPLNSVITPVKPQKWRVGCPGACAGEGFAVYNKLKAAGVTDIELSLTDYKGFGSYSNNWLTLIDNLTAASISQSKTFQWDLLNEPDQFFGSYNGGSPTYSNWYQMWNAGYNRVRQNIPSATIVGPSLSSYNYATITAFLDQAKASNTVPDILTWHELTSSPQAIQAQVTAIRAYMQQIGVSAEIELNEFVGNASGDNINPGLATQYFGAATRSNVRLIHASWFNVEGTDTAATPVMNGLLTNSYGTRGVWWAYKAYADLTGTLVPVTASANQIIDGVAAKDGSTAVRAVVGSGSFNGSYSVRFTNLGSTPYISTNGQTQMVIERYDLTTGAVNGPAATFTTTQTITNGTLEFDLAVFAGQSFKITLQKPAGGGTNLVTNPGFESGLTGWSTDGVPGVTAGTSTLSFGQAGTAFGYLQYFNQGYTSLYQAKTLTAGVPYTFSASVQSSGAPVRMLVYHPASNSLVTSLTFTNTTWSTRTLTFTPTVSGTYNIGFDSQGLSGGGDFARIDTVSLQ